MSTGRVVVLEWGHLIVIIWKRRVGEQVKGGAREAQNDLIDIKRHLYGDRRTNEDNSRAFIE